MKSRTWSEWFGDSRVVDGHGNALTVYHGTSASFTEFDPSRQGQTAGVGGGFFFTSSYEVARDVYGWRPNGRVIAAHLSIHNPLFFKEYFDKNGKNKEAEVGFDAPVNYFDNHWEEVIGFAKENGYDGIMWPADQDSKLAHDLIVAFDASQIRLVGEREAQKNFELFRNYPGPGRS